jgi:hypothetical protein
VVDGADVRVSLTLNLLDLHTGPVVDADGDEVVTYDEIDERIEAVYQAVRNHYHVRAPGEPIASTLERYELVGDAALAMELVYRFGNDVNALTIASTLPYITQPNHQHLVQIGRDGTAQMALLDRAEPVAVLLAGSHTTGWQTVQSLLRANRQLTAVSLLITTLTLPWAVRRVLLRTSPQTKRIARREAHTALKSVL